MTVDSFRIKIILLQHCGLALHLCLLVQDTETSHTHTPLKVYQQVFEIIPQLFESLPYHLKNPSSLHPSLFIYFVRCEHDRDCRCPLRCSVCCDHLTNWYYEKDGKLYCRKHYWEKFGELCHGCSLLMTGPAMVSLLHADSYEI